LIQENERRILRKMNNQQTEIVELFEKHGLSIELIAAEHEVSEQYVKAVLMQYSRVYKTTHAKLAGNNDYISDSTLRELYDAQLALALNAENEAVKLKAIQFLINDKRGRLDVEIENAKNRAKEDSKGKVVNINIQKFNVLIQRAKEQKELILSNNNNTEKLVTPAPKALLEEAVA
jgi:predicted DNA-binding protein YlxM (UPF0122 family)